MRATRDKESYELVKFLLNAIERSVLYKEDVLKCFHKIKAYSEELYEHSLNVALLSMVIGTELYNTQEELKELFIAALLHDYGKIYIPKSILDKSGPLTKEERKTIELHSVVGYFYLKEETNFSDNILNAVLDHHEKINGSGYGLNKTGAEISGYAKIISLADVYDAMVSDRVYRKRVDKDTAENHLVNHAGTQFDYEVTMQFIALMNQIDAEDMEQRFKDGLKQLTAKYSFLVAEDVVTFR